jgi:hypothetical protein
MAYNIHRGYNAPPVPHEEILILASNPIPIPIPIRVH